MGDSDDCVRSPQSSIRVLESLTQEGMTRSWDSAFMKEKPTRDSHNSTFK